MLDEGDIEGSFSKVCCWSFFSRSTQYGRRKHRLTHRVESWLLSTEATHCNALQQFTDARKKKKYSNCTTQNTQAVAKASQEYMPDRSSIVIGLRLVHPSFLPHYRLDLGDCGTIKLQGKPHERRKKPPIYTAFHADLAEKMFVWSFAELRSPEAIAVLHVSRSIKYFRLYWSLRREEHEHPVRDAVTFAAPRVDSVDADEEGFRCGCANDGFGERP